MPNIELFPRLVDQNYDNVVPYTDTETGVGVALGGSKKYKNLMLSESTYCLAGNSRTNADGTLDFHCFYTFDLIHPDN